MTDVCWLEQSGADVPAADDWLSAAELVRLSALRFPKRRADWRLGRWTAKRAVALYLKLSADPQTLAKVEIRSAPRGAPEVFMVDERAPVSISISHREGYGACGVARPEVLLGCDLEIVEPRGDAFAADYFTASEQERLARALPVDRLRLLALLWSGKESVLKALRMGLRIDTRLVSVDPRIEECPDGDWNPLRAVHEGQVFHGWWRQTGSLVRTLVARPAPERPLTFQT